MNATTELANEILEWFIDGDFLDSEAPEWIWEFVFDLCEGNCDEQPNAYKVLKELVEERPPSDPEMHLVALEALERIADEDNESRRL